MSSSFIFSIIILSIILRFISTAAHQNNGIILPLRKQSVGKRLLNMQGEMIGMRNFNRMQYYVELEVGSNRQPLQFLIDTGSSVIDPSI
jgi:hypothetical protein